MLKMVLETVSELITSFILGLLTPLTAVCVLPLYPGFLAFLSEKLTGSKQKKSPLFFGLIVSAGVISFMFLMGLIFTTILEVSLTSVIGIISPIAFFILGVVSILLIFNVDFSLLLPQLRIPGSSNPFISAFLFGFFFGAIVVPCNPLFIAALFVKAIGISDFILNIFNFLFFGLGISAPLIAFSLLSSAKSSEIIKFFGRNKRAINLITGLFMLAVSIYYLIYVFRILG
jgi:cytochrome c-type biogenesis protein